jgi:hypothetical protein
MFPRRDPEGGQGLGVGRKRAGERLWTEQPRADPDAEPEEGDGDQSDPDLDGVGLRSGP